MRRNYFGDTKITMKHFSTFICISFLLFSCTMEKRVYRNGYYIEHSVENKKPTRENFVVNNAPSSVKSFIKPMGIIDQKLIPLSNFVCINHKKQATDTTQCDEIIMTDGSTVKGKVTEIGVDEIKYKDCDNESGPITSVRKSDVFMIKYASGKTQAITTKQPSNHNSHSSSSDEK